MEREVRMVPADWQHPKNERGFIPLLGGNFEQRAAEWDEGLLKWAEGLRSDYDGGWKPLGDIESQTFEEWDGDRPVPEDYMPTFPEGTATHLMMYETVTEGTPISPAFATPEQLAHWLATTNASACGDEGASYEGWLRVCQGGYAPGMVFDASGLRSGVDL